MADGRKTCTLCHRDLPLSAFAQYARTARGGRTTVYSRCKECVRSTHDPLVMRKRVLRSRYGLTWEAFEAMLAAQGGGCGVCGASKPGGQGTWHIDHDHACCPTPPGRVKTCGRCVRGVLCHLCNTALGCARDSTDVLRKMIAYLEGGVGVG